MSEEKCKGTESFADGELGVLYHEINITEAGLIRPSVALFRGLKHFGVIYRHPSDNEPVLALNNDIACGEESLIFALGIIGSFSDVLRKCKEEYDRMSEVSND